MGVLDTLKKWFKGESTTLGRTPTKKEGLRHQLKLRPPARTKMEIDIFNKAIDAAESTINPSRLSLYSIYKQIARDGQVFSQMRTTRQKISGAAFELRKNGKPDGKALELLEKPWFSRYAEIWAETIFWGHSLVEFEQNSDSEFEKCWVIPRDHVHPWSGQVVFEATSTTGISYREKPYDSFLIEIGEADDLGLLMIAGFEAIYKKYSRGDWSRFSEKFGMPIISIKTTTREEEELDKLEEAAANMGTNGYIIMDDQDDMTFLQAANTDAYKLYLEHCNYCDAQISKIISGQTGTSDEKSFVGSAEVHERILEDYIIALLRKFQNHLNYHLLPFLIRKGYPLDGYKVQFIDLLPKPVLASPSQPSMLSFGLEKKKPEHPDGCPCCGEQTLTLSKPIFDLDKMAQKAIKKVYDGKLAKGDLDADTWRMNTEYLANSLGEGTIQYSDEQKDLVATMRRNIHVFAAFKNHKNIADMVDALTVSGQLREFDDFKIAASSIYTQYNQHWLETEYNTAVGSAQMALKWQDMEKNADIFPLLRYEAIQDDRTRTSHAELHGITLPFGHAFWDEYLPPNGWGCRCGVRQVAGGETAVPKNLPGVDPVFRFNAGKAKAVLNDENYKTGLSKQQQQNVLEAMYRLIAIEQKGFSTSLGKASDQLQDAAQKMGLTPEETAAVHFYTTAGFQNLNLRLRVGKRSDQDWAIENLIKKAFEKLPKHEGRVWRIVPLQGPKLIETLKVAAQSKEKLWVESAFTSSSAEQSFVEKFANPSTLSVIYEIESKNGRKIAKFSEKGDILNAKSNQHEVLFLPNSRFEIEEFTNITENIFFVKMKEL